MRHIPFYGGVTEHPDSEELKNKYPQVDGKYTALDYRKFYQDQAVVGFLAQIDETTGHIVVGTDQWAAASFVTLKDGRVVR
jgi:hypothetical protein